MINKVWHLDFQSKGNKRTSYPWWVKPTPNIDSSPVTSDQESKSQYTSEEEYSEEESEIKDLAEALAFLLHLDPEPILANPNNMNNMSNQQTTSTTATINATIRPTKLKLGQPSTFNGDATKARAWINNAQLYILVNQAVYNNNNKKIAYILSFMTEGVAVLWAFMETEKALQRSPPSFSAWQDFFDRYKALFIQENIKDQAIA